MKIEAFKEKKKWCCRPRRNEICKMKFFNTFAMCKLLSFISAYSQPIIKIKLKNPNEKLML